MRNRLRRPEERTHPTRASERFFLVLFALAAAAAVVPLWCVRYPPLQDLPQHLAAIRVLHSYDDPSYGFRAFFELHPLRTQYLAYYLAAGWLTELVPLPVANLLLLTASVVATPFALRALSRALGGDGHVGLLALPLTYNAHLVLGFFNFVAAIPMALYGIALAVRYRTHGRRRTAVLLALLAVLCFFTHVVPFAFLGLGAGLVGLGRDLGGSVRRLLPLLPATLVALVWLVVSPAGQATVGAAGAGNLAGEANTHAKPDYRPAGQAIEELPMWLTDVLQGEDDTRLLYGWVGFVAALLVLLLVPRLRAPSHAQVNLRLRLWLLPAAAVLLYFVAPSGYQWIWPIAPRFAVLACLLCLAPLPAMHPILRRSVLVVAMLLTLGHAATTARAFRGFEEEVGDFEGALARIPKAQTVAGLIFDRGSRHVRFSPFIHYVAYYQAQKGGAVMFTFADFPQSPFVFRRESRPPRVPPRWEWMPQRVQPARDLPFYNYVLVRGGPGPIGRDRQHYRPLFRSRHWSVFERK